MRFALLLILLAMGAPAGAAAVPLVATGMPSPLGLPLSTMSGISLMEDGSVTFLGTSNGAFHRTASGLVRVVAAGDRLADGRTVAGVSAPAVGPGGCVAVRAFLVDGGSRILRRCGVGTCSRPGMRTGRSFWRVEVTSVWVRLAVFVTCR